MIWSRWGKTLASKTPPSKIQVTIHEETTNKNIGYKYKELLPYLEVVTYSRIY